MREWFEASPALAREIGQSLEVRRRALAALRAAPPVATAATTAAATAGEPAPDA
jgi:hypothetical protein